MKTYTQAEFDAIPRDEYGVKQCPTGDYTQISRIGEECSFGERCSFGEECSFGERCSFGEECIFGEWCSFGEECSFGERCSFGRWCIFSEWCRIGEECSFGEECGFGEECSFGERCSFENGKVQGGNIRMLQISRIGSRNGCTYFWRHEGSIFVRCGCFAGDIDVFVAEVEKTHVDNPQYLREYRGAVEYARAVLTDAAKED